MIDALRPWLTAFALTQALEMPIYRWASKSWRVAFFASAITHPVVWFIFPQLVVFSVPWPAVIALAETFAVVVEWAWLRANKVERALAWSLVANGFSFTTGLVLRELTGWV